MKEPFADLLPLPGSPDAPLSLAEILGALSYSLDLTSGQAMGHAQRTCLIGMRLGREIGLSDAQSSSLYYALLMKDAGCSSNAARMFEIFGSDDIEAKRAAKVVDWSNLVEALKYAAHHTLPESPLLARARRMLSIAANPGAVNHSFMHSRCSRGAQIALAIGLGEDAADCIRHLDEHWNGQGQPYQIKGDRIPLLARIACMAQTMEVFNTTFGLGAAYEVVRTRSKRWFDPGLVQAAHAFRQDDAFWQGVQQNTHAELRRLDVRTGSREATDASIDNVCDAFAQIVDAKSPFTSEHSARVSGYAVEIAQLLGFEAPRLLQMRRAGLLHDVGKLAVSNAILDKPGPLNDDEWIAIRRHPYYSQKILGQIRGFERLTQIAAAHHERLDGKGYFQGMTADHLDLDMRILACADVFDALSASRPYRDAMPMSKVFAILDKDAGIALDADCIAALKSRYGGWESMPPSGPAPPVSKSGDPLPTPPAQDDLLRPLFAA